MPSRDGQKCSCEKERSGLRSRWKLRLDCGTQAPWDDSTEILSESLHGWLGLWGQSLRKLPGPHRSLLSTAHGALRQRWYERSQSTQGMSKGSSAVVLPEPHGFFYCCDKLPKGNLGRKGFVQLIYTFSQTDHSPSLKESKAGTLRQELRDRGGISLTGLLLLASSVYIPGSTAHGQNCPKVLDPSTSVISQENDPQSCTRACFKEAFCLVEFPS